MVAPEIRFYQKRESLGRTEYRFPTALEPVVREALRRADCEVQIRGEAPGALPEPDEAGLAQLGVIDRVLLDAVRRHGQALVRLGAGVDPALLVAQLARAWPTKTLAVAVATREDARRLGRALRAFLPDVSVITGQTSPAEVAPVVVTTYPGLGHTARCRPPGPRLYDLSWLDVVVCVDALAATGNLAGECLSHAHRARLVGLLPADAKPAPLESDLLACLFGFHEICVPRHGHRERPVRVVRYPIPEGAELPASLEGLPLKRRSLWHHALRNRKVARVADALYRGDAATVREMLGGGATPDAPCGVVVVTEGVEHALALAPLLPDWPLGAGGHVHEGGLSPAQLARLHRPPDPFGTGPRRAILTSACLADADLAGVDVLVRADGGVGLPPLDERKLVEPDAGPERPLLLVDFQDRHHPRLRRRSRLRREAYAERGWLAPGADPERARVERFLASRPREVPR